MFKLKFIFVLTLTLGLNAIATDMDICVKNNYLKLSQAINSHVEEKAVPVMKNFLLELYRKNGIVIIDEQIALIKIKYSPMLVNYNFDVSADLSKNSFSAIVQKSPGVTNVQATNNAVYDSFGNLVSPATHVTCTGLKDFRRTVTVINLITNQNVGNTLLPDDLACDISIDNCEVTGSVVIPL